MLLRFGPKGLQIESETRTGLMPMDINGPHGIAVSPDGALVAAAQADGLPLSAMVKDDTRCIRCGLCAIRCPTDAMTMERFSISERLVPLASSREAA